MCRRARGCVCVCEYLGGNRLGKTKDLSRRRKPNLSVAAAGDVTRYNLCFSDCKQLFFFVTRIQTGKLHRSSLRFIHPVRDEETDAGKRE